MICQSITTISQTVRSLPCPRLQQSGQVDVATDRWRPARRRRTAAARRGVVCGRAARQRAESSAVSSSRCASSKVRWGRRGSRWRPRARCAACWLGRRPAVPGCDAQRICRRGQSVYPFEPTNSTSKSGCAAQAPSPGLEKRNEPSWRLPSPDREEVVKHPLVCG